MYNNGKWAKLPSMCDINISNIYVLIVACYCKCQERYYKSTSLIIEKDSQYIAKREKQIDIMLLACRQVEVRSKGVF